MARTMTYPDWHRAQGHISAIRQRLLLAHLEQLHALTDEAKRVLEIERNPAIAALHLQSLVDRLESHPALRESVQLLSSWLVQFQAVARRGEEPADGITRLQKDKRF